MYVHNLEERSDYFSFVALSFVCVAQYTMPLFCDVYSGICTKGDLDKAALSILAMYEIKESALGGLERYYIFLTVLSRGRTVRRGIYRSDFVAGWY